MSPVKNHRFWQGIALATLGAATAGVGMFLLSGWIKDDAYISFRYARHLAAGVGLVFNPGERVEGYTNFLWVIIMALVHVLQGDMVFWSKALSYVAAVASIGMLLRIERLSSGASSPPLFGLPSFFLGVSTTLAVYADSGLETTSFLFFSLLGFRSLYAGKLGRSRWAGILASALFLSITALFRPEGHLVIVIAALLVVYRLETRVWTRKEAFAWILVTVAVLAPYHAWRIAYFGDIFPNTYYVKAGGGLSAFTVGVRYVWSLMKFNLTGPLLVLAVFGLLNQRVPFEFRLVSGAMTFSFMGYLLYIGTDEMNYYRLYLVAFPHLHLLAARGMESLEPVVKRLKWRYAPLAAVLAVMLTVGVLNGRETLDLRGLGKSMDASKNSHAAMGRFLSQHSAPGEAVLFQDMGLTPWMAPKLNFIDPIGLVDRTVAHAYKEYGYHAFLRAEIMRSKEGRERYEKLAQKMRDYFLGRQPAWVAFVAYIPPQDQEEVSRTLKKFPNDVSPLAFYITHYDHFTFELFADPRFQEQYRFIHFYPRSSRYYLVMYERMDHVRPRSKMRS